MNIENSNSVNRNNILRKHLIMTYIIYNYTSETCINREFLLIYLYYMNLIKLVINYQNAKYKVNK